MSDKIEAANNCTESTPSGNSYFCPDLLDSVANDIVLFIYDENCRFLYMSQAIEQYTGNDASFYLNKKVEMLLALENEELCDWVKSNQKKELLVWIQNTTLKAKLIVKPYNGKQAQKLFTGILTDISSLTEHRMRTILENSLHYFIAFSANHKIEVMNTAAQELFGNCFHTTLRQGEAFSLLFETYALYRRAFEKAMNGKNYDFEMQLSINGNKEWFQLFTSPLYNLKREIDGVFLNIYNINSRKEQENKIIEQNAKIKRSEENLRLIIEELNQNKEELEASTEELKTSNDELVYMNLQMHESEVRFSSFINNSTDAVFITDRFGDIQIWNHSMEVISGKKMGEVLQKSLWTVYNEIFSQSLIKECDFEFTKKEFFYLLKTGDKTISKQINRIVFQDNRIIELIVFPIKLGRKYAIGGIARNTTQIYTTQFERDLFFALLNQTDDLAIVKDLNFRYLAVNNAFMKFVGNPSPDEIKGKKYSEIIDPNHPSIKSSDQNDDILLQNPDIDHLLNRFEANVNGQNVVYLEKKFKIRDKNNQIIAIASISRDITKLAEAETKIVEQIYEIQQQKKRLELKNAEMFSINSILEESKAKLKSLFDFSPFGICSINRNFAIENFNLQFEKFVSDFLFADVKQNTKISDIYKGDEAVKYIKRIVKAFKGESHEYVDEFENNERKCTVNTIYSPVVGENAEVRNVLLIISDITDKKKAELDLIHEKNLLQTLMDYSIDHIYFKDKQCRFVRNNKSQLKFIHRMGIFTDNELIGKTDGDVFGEEFLAKTYEDEQRIIETGVPIIDREELFEPGEQKIKSWFSSTKMPWYDDKGEIIGTFGITRDITIRKRALAELSAREAELNELNATKDKFFSIIAHDLKNPFSTVIQFSELILSTIHKRDYEKITRFVGFISSAANTAFNLLENLLQWSRAQTGRIEIAPENTNINSTIDETVDFLWGNAKNKNITINIKHQGSPFIFADKNMMLTILRNLISNAVKFTFSGGNINIITEDVFEDQKKFVQITVEDNGIGIRKESIDNLFRIDVNVSTTGTNDEQGTGLGLILCNEFVRMNGGKIWVDSIEGMGSKFMFTVPAGAPTE